MAVTDNRKMPKWVLIIGQSKNDPETQTEPFKPICLTLGDHGQGNAR